MSEGEDQAPQENFGIGQASPEQGTLSTETRVEIRTQGRLVNLRRDAQGQYQILMRDRVIQGFCSEFEDITGWNQPLDTQVQARIAIHPTGRLRAATYHDLGSGQDRIEPMGLDIQTRLRDDGIALESRAHPVPWQVEALARLRVERDQMEQAIDMIESLRLR